MAAEIRKHVHALDGLVRYRFGDNAELMEAWGERPDNAVKSGWHMDSRFLMFLSPTYAAPLAVGWRTQRVTVSWVA